MLVSAATPATAEPSSPLTSSPQRQLVGMGLAATLLAILAGMPALGAEWLDDLGEPLWHAAGELDAVPWPYVPLLVLLSGLHYVCAAAALRAASGQRMRLPEITMAQIAAAAASRLTPAGLGAIAVNTRYLNRRGLALPQALSAIGTIKLAGGLTHLGLLAAVIATPTGLARLTDPHHLIGRHHLLIAAAVVLVLVLALVWRGSDHAAILRGVAETATALARNPRGLLTLFAASAGTPIALGGAFALSLIAVPGGPPSTSVGVLLGVYLIGSAVGAAVPLPSGAGSSEAALTAAATVAVGIPAVVALQGVLLFRVVTFWLPVPIGVLAARHLRRNGAL